MRIIIEANEHGPAMTQRLVWLLRYTLRTEFPNLPVEVVTKYKTRSDMAEKTDWVKELKKLADLAKELVPEPEPEKSQGVSWGTTTDKITVDTPTNKEDPKVAPEATEVCIVCFGEIRNSYKERHLAWHRRQEHGL